MSRKLKWLVLVVALLGGLVVAGQMLRRQAAQTTTAPAAGAASGGGRGGEEQRPVPVVLRPVEVRPMPVLIETIGTVQPVATVAVKARIDSVVEAVHFQEGQEVAAGDPLFTLDARNGEASLRQAEAALERDQAQLERARADLRRSEALLQRGATALQQADMALANAHALEATVKADMAAIENARLTLDYTRITAPMAARTGAIFARPGNSVRPGDSQPLVVLTQLRPITVAFSIAERDLPAVRRAAAADGLAVRARVPNDETGVVEGTLSFIDSAVDSQSGTVQIKGLFENADTRLWPGQYVEVSLRLRVEPEARVVPSEAVLIGQDGNFVYLASPEHKAVVRPVQVGWYREGLAVITEGLAPGERVVVDGYSRLAPGLRMVERGSSKEGPGKEGPGKGASGKDAAS